MKKNTAGGERGETAICLSSGASGHSATASDAFYCKNVKTNTKVFANDQQYITCRPWDRNCYGPFGRESPHKFLAICTNLRVQRTSALYTIRLTLSSMAPVARSSNPVKLPSSIGGDSRKPKVLG